MKCLSTMLVAFAVVFTCGFAIGQQTVPVSEHLKPYRAMIGTWRYEGPVLEDVPDMAEKGTNFVVDFTWRRILDKQVVMEGWSGEFENGVKFSGRALIGWNAADKRLAYGSMNSNGAMNLGTVVFDSGAKTSTLTTEGVDGEGNTTTFKGVVTKTGKDTLTWQALERTGGKIEGPSPVYTFKRVERAKQEK